MTPGIAASTRRVSFAMALIGALAWTASVHAQRQDDAFKAGLEARKNQRWAEAAEQMRRAIQVDGREDTRKVDRNLLGFGGTEYLPYFFLGEARFFLNDCAGAEEAWRESQGQGVVQRSGTYEAQIRDGYAECEAKGFLLRERYTRVRSDARQQLADVNKQLTAISDRGSDVWQAHPTMRERFNRGREEYQAATQRLQEAERSRRADDFKAATDATEQLRVVLVDLTDELERAIARVSRARSLADEVKRRIAAAQGLENDVEATKERLTPPQTANRNDAGALLTQARAQHTAGTETSMANALTSADKAHGLLEQLLGELEQNRRRRAAARLESATAEATASASSVEQLLADVEAEMAKASGRVPPEIPGQIDVARQRVASVKRRLASAEQKEDLAGVESASAALEQVSADLQTMVAVFRPVTLEDRGVPPWLQSGAALFFRGAYDEALAALDPTLGTAPGSSQLHVHLFRAAALHALFVRSGETLEAHRTRALTEIEQCKLIDPDFQPDTRAFSPRFIALYQNAAAP